MNDANLAATIDAAWEARDTLGPQSRGAYREAVEEALDALDAGRMRVAEKKPGPAGRSSNGSRRRCCCRSASTTWSRSRAVPIDPERGAARWWDKVPSKFAGWSSNRFRDAGFRAVPGSIVRRSAYIAPNVVLMPSFVNVGAYVDAGTMVDTWATVGSCAQIGKNCHLSGGVGIGGVLEPLQAEPVIIEDNCFIGARSEVVEGVVVETGAVLAMGTFIGATTKIVDRDTGEILMGRVPAYSVVVPGSLPGKNLPDGRPGPEPLLRGHRQEGRRGHPRTHLDQRAAAGMSETALDPATLAGRADPPAERHPEGRGRARPRRRRIGAAGVRLSPSGLWRYP